MIFNIVFPKPFIRNTSINFSLGTVSYAARKSINIKNSLLFLFFAKSVAILKVKICSMQPLFSWAPA